MHKLISLIVLSALAACVSVTRQPSAIDKNRFRFNLYGHQPAPNVDYRFELLNLHLLHQRKIEFKKFNLAEHNAEALISAWQQEFKRVRSENKSGFQFEENKTIVDVDKGDLRNLEEALEAIDLNEQKSQHSLKKKIEVISAFNHKFKDATDIKFEVMALPFTVMSYLGTYGVKVDDSSPALNVPNTSFWQRRQAHEVDMFKGYGQMDIRKLDQDVCAYAGPKSGFGANAGLKVKCSGQKLKVKFGTETYSAPLNSRLYHRVGYNVPAIHHARALKIAYDRRIFTEFNSRKANVYRIRVFGKEAASIQKPTIYDARNFITSAQLKNGQRMTTNELIQNLLHSCQTPVCDYSDANINKAFETEIATLTFQPSAVVEEIGEEVGSWDFSGLDHGQRPELKALLLLGAWTGNFDIRRDNTKLVWVKETGEMKHFISDPGSGLVNQANPWMTKTKIEDMRWSTAMDSRTQEGDELKDTVILNYRTYVQQDTFRRVTYQDAQWMARLIAEISEDEISEALVASGFSSAEFLLLREKLVSIQQNYIKQFKLAEFTSKLRPINKKLSFDPNGEPLQITLKNGRSYKLENRNIRLHEGSLIYPQ